MRILFILHILFRTIEIDYGEANARFNIVDNVVHTFEAQRNAR